MDLVSIIMPYHKKREYIKSAILSVLNQTYQNFEIYIIFDDKNKDGSLKSPLQDMTHNQMMENRKTKHYDDFVNGVFVNLVELVTHTLTGHPLVQ